MRARAQMRAMGNGRALPDGHAPEIVDEGVFADGAVVARLQVPREINGRGIVDVNLPPNLRAKTPQQKHAPAKARARAETEQRLGAPPKHTPEEFAWRIFLRLPVLLNIDHRKTES